MKGSELMNSQILTQNKASWDAIADDWFGTTALPTYGVLVPTEEQLHLLGDLSGKRVLDIGCGSGHSLKYCGEHGASELYGLDLSSRQIENARRFLGECGFVPVLFNQPMEDNGGIPTDYFDAVYSVYAVGWTTDLQRTFNNAASYLKKGGILVFSWDHPFMHCVDAEGDRVIFTGNYNKEDIFTFEKGGEPMTLKNRRLSSYINALAEAGFAAERVIEETDNSALEREGAFSSSYYSEIKARKFPLSVIIKARKL